MEKDEFFIDLDKENEFRVSLTCLSDLKNSTDQFSNLDQLIRKTWQTKMHEEEGNFRYKMIHPECKKLPGKIGYLAQFNPNRSQCSKIGKKVKISCLVSAVSNNDTNQISYRLLFTHIFLAKFFQF